MAEQVGSLEPVEKLQFDLLQSQFDLNAERTRSLQLQVQLLAYEKSHLQERSARMQARVAERLHVPSELVRIRLDGTVELEAPKSPAKTEE